MNLLENGEAQQKKKFLLTLKASITAANVHAATVLFRIKKYFQFQNISMTFMILPNQKDNL